jgi:ribulose bisphosphate carboxylase small subunit
MLRVIYNSQTYWAMGIFNAVSAGSPGILVGVRLFLNGGNGLSDPIPTSDVGLTIIGGGGSGGGLDAEAVQDLMATVLTAGSGVTLTYNDAANTITIAATGGGSLTDEQIDDRVAALLQAGSGISLTYNDASNTLTIAATGGASLTLEDVQDNLGTAFLVPGTGMSVVYNDSLNILTLSNTAPFTDEAVDDRVAALLQAGAGITLTYNDAGNALTIAASAAVNPLPRNFIQGCLCSPNLANPNTHLDISDGTVWIANAGRTLEFLRTMVGATKRANANWAAGTGQGGVFTGANLVANTWYGVYAMFNPTTQATDWGFSTVAADGTDAPVGWLTRRVAYIRSNSSSQIVGFSQAGRYFQWTTPSIDVNGVVNVPTVATLYPLLVPPYRRRVNFQGVYFGNSYDYLWLSSPLIADLAPDVNSGRISLQPGSGASAGSVSPYGNFNMMTDDSGRIRARASALTAVNALTIATLGWEDDRDWDFA